MFDYERWVAGLTLNITRLGNRSELGQCLPTPVKLPLRNISNNYIAVSSNILHLRDGQFDEVTVLDNEKY
jgi:hypothetical protein